ncbi:molybdate ABC transporter substrate-binding protein [Sanguibacter massiliensis]|uniref:molybdate ABC transporter substrate-binding protein n=1 Tax=Sanguibacter massiliensis TaxID=1973217 RepID=UPI000C832529|nr:molybdate ABC transporter substrate-binding protein [Sanguibacter massiliensis]
MSAARHVAIRPAAAAPGPRRTRPAARQIASRHVAALALAALAASGLVACADAAPSSGTASGTASFSGASSGTVSPSGTTPAVAGRLVVLAAASLQPALTELGDELEAAHPGLQIDFSFAASSALAEQVVAGAPADLLLTASAATMTTAAERVTDQAVFAGNTLVIVTPPDNPGKVATLTDLENGDLRLALCAEEVPCGAAAAQVIEQAGLTVTPDTYAENVTAALTLAVTGEVDAALVYTTDAKDAGEAVRTIEVPEAASVVNDYLVATVAEAPNPAAAAAFRALLDSERGRAALTDAGFRVP